MAWTTEEVNELRGSELQEKDYIRNHSRHHIVSKRGYAPNESTNQERIKEKDERVRVLIYNC